MRQFGLIGYPLSHSFSPKWFADFFLEQHIKDAEYDLYPLKDISLLPQLVLENENLIGLNVTIPHKHSVIQLMNNVHLYALEIGAVNVIRIHRDSGDPKLIGYNTDFMGFEQSLKPLLKPYHQKALIFGSGGASLAVQYVLFHLGINFKIVSRNQSENTLSYQNLTDEILKSHTLWVNTTPIGMFPDINSCLPINYSACSPSHIAYDLIYNPEKTLFLKNCEGQGACIMNGQKMLEIQALESAKIFGLLKK